MTKNPKKFKNIYFIGLKGVGMTMLAQFLAARGNKVSGSDVSDTFMTDVVLRRAGLKIFSPFSPKNIPTDLDLIIYSSAYNPKNNSELAYITKNPARFRNIRLLSYAEALGEIFNQHEGIAVCGSHGKTTTTAWLGYVLQQAGKDPNVLVGSRVPQFKGSSLVGRSRLFVAEADEYQNKLRYFKPRGVVLNNIDYDHPDFYKTPAAYEKAFADFLRKIPKKGFLIMNNRDAASRRIRKYCRGRIISYGLATDPVADYVASAVRAKGDAQIFKLTYRGRALGEFKIRLGGEHNILNALAVIAAARELKVPPAAIRKGLAAFRGTARRAEILGRYRGALIIDDYAHHPTEIKATLQGLRVRYPRKNLITIFHPHTFTRTKALFKDFVRSFADTDELIVLDIYGSARETQGGVTSAQLVAAIKEYDQGTRPAAASRHQPSVRHIPTLAAAANYLRRRLKSQDVLILMGAGDVFRIADNLLSR